MSRFKWPLMKDGFRREDLDAVISLLKHNDPVLTQGCNVRDFERQFSEWLGVKHSVMVNSGASANMLTMAALREMHGPIGSVIVPPLTWSSDVASVIHAGYEPRFVDIDRRTLGMDVQSVKSLITAQMPVAVFTTHCMGYDAFANDVPWIDHVPLVEDCCESIGATHEGIKLGTFGLASNFSFYYAHHMTTVEGGMVCTDDDNFYELVRMLRGHGMVREMGCPTQRSKWIEENPELSPDFIFAVPGYNVRSTEIAAVLGMSQLRRLDENIAKRNENLHTFLSHLDGETYQTDFATAGCSSYAFTLVLQHPDMHLRDAVETMLNRHGIEFRRGIAGGGNQLRQPYLKRRFGTMYSQFPNVEHVHYYGWYIGNFPSLEKGQIVWLCDQLNKLAPVKVPA